MCTYITDFRKLNSFIHSYLLFMWYIDRYSSGLFHSHCGNSVLVPMLIKYGLMLTWWRHQMETFSALLAICARNSPVLGEFPAQSQWRGALIFSLVSAWINGWVNNREAGHLGCHRACYDVIVMTWVNLTVVDHNKAQAMCIILVTSC